MKDWPVGPYLVINSKPWFPYYITLMAIGYQYNSQKVIGFISAEGDDSTVPDYSYLSCFPDMFYDVSICPVVCPRILGR